MKSIQVRQSRRTSAIPLRLAAICALMVLTLPSPLLAQTQDPIVGTWNLIGLAHTKYAYIALQTFNAGGTTLEYSNAATGNTQAASNIVMGKWGTTSSGYSVTGQNYIDDSSGNLLLTAIGECNLKLSSDNQSFSGTCSAKFYKCSVSQCPGKLVGKSGPGSITGTRF
jgi:hypothetical protein